MKKQKSFRCFTLIMTGLCLMSYLLSEGGTIWLSTGVLVYAILLGVDAICEKIEDERKDN